MDSYQSRSEVLVHRICLGSFFSLWSYANPRGKDAKELCDVLVVCDPEVIIFSIKEVAYKETPDVSTGWTRWERRAVEESRNQIFGAERWLADATSVIRHDGSPGIALPDVSRRRIHRIAVALGSGREVPISTGDDGRGYVHVFTEDTLNLVMGELDTIEDFVQYLRAVENIGNGRSLVIIEGAEADLLALYLANNRSFPGKADHFIVTEGIWDAFRKKPEYLARKEAEKISQLWDGMIAELADSALHGKLESGSTLDNNELGIRVMARETRFARRVLSKDLADYFEKRKASTVAARMTRSPSGVVYVFLAEAHGSSREARTAELGLRCFVARGLHQKAQTVVGIATEIPEAGRGHSLDLCYLHLPEWSSENQEQMVKIQKELRLFANPQWARSSVDEYPRSGTGQQP